MSSALSPSLLGRILFTDANLDIEGEYIRSKLIEDQEGVPLTVDLQFIDVETCDPVRGAVIEIWSMQNPFSVPCCFIDKIAYEEDFC